MVSHKYELGQDVRLMPNRRSSLVGSQQCKIMRLLPIEDGSYLYRIKCVAEKGKRVAKEGELASTGSINQEPPPNEKATR